MEILTPADLYDRINKLFIELQAIKEDGIKELKDMNISEETAHFLIERLMRKQIVTFLERLNK